MHKSFILAIKPMIKKRLFGGEEGINDHINYKRLRDFNTTDGVECLTTRMDRLSVDKVCSSTFSRSIILFKSFRQI